MPGCLILDDDEICMPVAISPIDAYRGTGRVVKKIERIQSKTCAYSCMGHQMTGSCCCDNRIIQIGIRLDEVREEMKAYDKKTNVGFGKYKDYRWEHMFGSREIKSWSEWYLKNCSNKGKFYEYLVLLKEERELLDDYNYIRNPNYD